MLNKKQNRRNTHQRQITPMIFFMGCFLLLGGCTNGGAPQQAAVNQTESPNTSGGETTESSLEILRNHPDYAEAYADKIEELEKECRELGDIEYDLIYLDEDHIPELVAGQTGYYVNEQEITGDEYDSYLMEGEYLPVIGDKAADEILSLLQTDAN